jgi:hypothetical protein
VINLDVRDSVADWGPFMAPEAEGAPNVLIVLYDDTGPLKTQPGHFALCGEGLSIGRDSSDPVSHEYTGGFDFTGGKIHEVEVNIGDDVYLDIERDFAAAMARD